MTPCKEWSPIFPILGYRLIKNPLISHHHFSFWFSENPINFWWDFSFAFYSHFSYTISMPWIPFTLTRKRIEQAWEDLREYPLDRDSLDTLADFRSAHAYPLNSIQVNLRTKAKKIAGAKWVIISQRLKRIPSILSKLTRESGMNLARMQDIGGCRAIFSSITEVYGCMNAMRTSTMQHNPPRKLNDYIENPKSSGYRGIHMIYEFTSDSTQFSQYTGMLIEIQLRTNLQHYWATAVETVGIFTRQSLKSSQWSEDWQQFFRLASNWFALREWQKLIPWLPDTKEWIRTALKAYMSQLKIEETLAGFSHTINFADRISKEEKQKEGYLLLILDTTEHTIQIKRFSNSEINLATDLYANQEQKNQESQDKQIVLFSLESAINLKKAYPNYFWDTKDFMKNLNEIFV